MLHKILSLRKGSIIISLGIIFTITGCTNYFKISQLPQHNKVKKIDSLMVLGKYFILQNGTVPLRMTQIRVDENTNTLNCKLSMVSEDHLLYMPGMTTKDMSYTQRENKVLKEVHIYSPKDENAKAETTYSLNMNSISLIEVIQKDQKRSAGSQMIGFGIAAGLLILVIVCASAITIPVL